MQKFLVFLSLFFACNVAKASVVALKAFAWADETYIQNLENCTPLQNIQTLQFGENSINLYQEISGFKDNKCQFSLGVIEEYFLQCNLPQSQLNLIVKYLKDNSQSEDDFSAIINNPEYCRLDEAATEQNFKDTYGVEFGCDTPMNVRMVSDDECRKCSNRTLAEDSEIVVSGQPLTYCVLKFCPQGYFKQTDGECIKQN